MNFDAQDVDELQAKACKREAISEESNDNVRKRLTNNSQNDRENKKNELTQRASHKKTEEQKNIGAVGVSMYFQYFRSGGSYLIMVCIVLGFLSSQVLFNFTDYWLSAWTNALTETGADEDIKKDQDFYTYVYCGLMASFIFIAVFRALLFFRYCMKISINLHDTMFESIVRAPVKFFDDNPSGKGIKIISCTLSHFTPKNLV